MIYIAILLYVLAIPFVIDSLRGKWPSVALWPVGSLLGILWAIGEALWDNRPRWRWRRQWVREPRYSHYGWKTKTGKMCGIIVCYEIVTHKAGNYGTVSGIMLPWGKIMLGTLTKPVTLPIPIDPLRPAS